LNNLKKNKFIIVVNAHQANTRLDRFLLSAPEISDLKLTRSYIQDIIDKNFILVNGKSVKSSFIVKSEDHITLDIPVVEKTELLPYDFPLDIVYEDNDLIVVNKPSGLVIHPAAGHQQDTLVNALLNHTQNLSMKNELRPGIVHRIDKETSGLIVIAKNDYSHEHLSQQFKNKETHRVYYAVTDGHLKTQKGTIKSYLARHPSDRKRYASVKINNKIISQFDESFTLGKWSVTHYEAVEYASNKTLVRLKLETGRTHQIRVHLSEMNHCLIGDLTYGFSPKKYKELKLSRFYLHAAELGFTHPQSLAKLFFKTSWPTTDQEIIKHWGFTHYA